MKKNSKKRKLNDLDDDEFEAFKKIKVNSDKELDQLDHLLLRQKLFRIPIYGDGHCMYRALLYGIKSNPPSETEVKEMRIKVAQYLANHHNEYRHLIKKADLSKYLQGIRENVWGGELETRLISEIYKIKIRIFEKINIDHEIIVQEKTIYCPNDCENPKEVILLFRNLEIRKPNNHYDLLKSFIELPPLNDDQELYNTDNKSHKDNEKVKLTVIKDLKDYDNFFSQSDQNKNKKPDQKTENYHEEEVIYDDSKIYIGKTEEVKHAENENITPQSKNSKKLNDYKLTLNEEDKLIIDNILESQLVTQQYPYTSANYAFDILTTNKIPDNILKNWDDKKYTKSKMDKKKWKFRNKIKKKYALE